MRFHSKILSLAATVTAILGLTVFSGCGGGSGDNGIAAGDTVSLRYSGTLDDGSVFDSTMAGNPFKFVAGAGQVIPGFDEAVLGMKLNESKTFTIPDSLAYGPRNEPMLQKVPNSFFPDDSPPEIGRVIQLQNNQGQPFPGTVTEIAADSVTLSLDYNHPLAGENLTFDIEVVGIIQVN